MKATKCTKKRDARAVVVLLIKPIVVPIFVLRFPLPSSSWFRKVPIEMSARGFQLSKYLHFSCEGFEKLR